MAAASREPVWGEGSSSSSSTPMVDGYGGSGSQLPTASPEQQRQLQRMGAPAALAQLTPQEARALENVRKTATNAKNIGYVAGLSAAIYFARRRKPPLTPLATGGLAMMGMFVGGVSAVPFGVFMGRSYLQDVEDPKHLATVLQGAIEERRSGGIPPPSAVSGPPGGQGSIRGQSGQQPPRLAAPAPQPTFPGDAPFPGMSSDSNTNEGSSYGGQGFSSGGFSSDAAPPSSDGSSYGSGWSGSSPDPSQSQQQQQQQQGQAQVQGGGSRWAELRGEATKTQSSWDKLRGPAGAAQARGAARSTEGYGPSGGGGEAGPPAPGRATSSAGSASASSDFMSGIEAEREKARREYEASFERERRGID